MNSITLTTNSVIETQKLAADLSHLLKSGDVVLLEGDLGAGKTTFVGGFLKELGYNGHVISPTFNILKCYFEVSPNVFHIDAYRLEDNKQDLGLEEFIEGEGICLIEWPIYIKELIPVKHLKIALYRIDDNKRKIVISSDDKFYKDVFSFLKENYVSVAS